MEKTKYQITLLFALILLFLSLSACSSMNDPKPGHSTSWTDDMLGTSDTSNSEESFSSKMLKSNDTSKLQQVY